ncbi:hypothetical protein A4U53_031010 [Rhizobium ruizarguesonis]|uniref:Uncharacterized protein n=2 Tax=Rhizobium TaxID=379 RepID=A0A179BVK2_RHILE|nr:hypothetical protein [Rhizobium leguminosarum]OAP95134.1 hypothetical protein A4U53_18100 [Rhizobium leguminosarum]
MTQTDGWKKKFKGSDQGGARIYTHADALDGRAIVENHNGIWFNGKRFLFLDDAKRAALSHLQVTA